MIPFLVVQQNYRRVITIALDDFNARNRAHKVLGGNPDEYVVEKLARNGDEVHLDMPPIRLRL